MLVAPVSFNRYIANANSAKGVNFGHEHNTNNYDFKQKAIIATTSTIGVLSSLVILAKHAGYSINPSKMFKNIKKSYLATADFEAKEVIAMGAGSCLGGLIGGYLVDKDPKNRQAKRRETIMQIGNVSIPILFVHLINKKIFAKSSETVKALASLGGVMLGVMTSNIVMNKLNNIIFDEKAGDGRKMKFTDFSAHLDDVVVAANYISKDDWVRAIGRLVPAARTQSSFEI